MLTVEGIYKDGKISGDVLDAKRGKGPFVMRDDRPVLEFFTTTWQSYDGTGAGARKVAEAVLANTAIWGEDLNKVDGLTAAVAGYLQQICASGMAAAVEGLLGSAKA